MLWLQLLYFLSTTNVFLDKFGHSVGSSTRRPCTVRSCIILEISRAQSDFIPFLQFSRRLVALRRPYKRWLQGSDEYQPW
jgi:hypothetical protein